MAQGTGGSMTGVQRAAYLRAMGIDVWRRREATESTTGDDTLALVSRSAAAPSGSAASATSLTPEVMDWEQLAATVSGCTACELHRSRTLTVFGVGNRDADWMIIGEAPGADEDRQGEPFVGRAGQLLNALLFAIGLERAQVFIANILKCRPPRNRDPAPIEVASCRAFLDRQIELVNPKIILSIGRVSSQSLLGTTTPVGRLRGKVYQYGRTDVPLIVTYHPAYLLRSPLEKRKVWADLQLAQRTFDQRLQ